MVFRNIRYSKLEISRRCHFCVMLEARKSCLGDIMEALRVCGMPYLMPTPTRGSALATLLTVAWSGNVKNTEAAGKISRLLTTTNKSKEDGLPENIASL